MDRKHTDPTPPVPSAAAPRTAPLAASSSAWQALGSHRIRIVTDLVEWEGIGPVSVDDIREYQGVRERVIERCGYCVALVNAKSAGSISPDARRFLVEQSRTRTERRVATAVYGIAGAAHAMAALVIRAMDLLGKRKNQILICGDEATARAWLDNQRGHYRGSST